MRKRTGGFLKMRRQADFNRLVFAYCAAGLVLAFAQVAFSADETCAATYSEIENSKSPAMRAVAPILRGQSFTNLSNGTHLKFDNSNRINMSFYSTTGTGDKDLDFKEGSIKLCESAGKFEITSVLSSTPASVEFETPCFKVVGFKGAMMGKKASFCPGKMPFQVSAAKKRDDDKHNRGAVASHPVGRSASGAIRQ